MWLEILRIVRLILQIIYALLSANGPSFGS